VTAGQSASRNRLSYARQLLNTIVLSTITSLRPDGTFVKSARFSLGVSERLVLHVTVTHTNAASPIITS